MGGIEGLIRESSGLCTGRDRRSDYFDISEGLKQGCPLSCILFLFFINALLIELRESGMGASVGGVIVAALAFADDVALLAESLEKLGGMFLIVMAFCKKWRLTINYDKCAVLRFEQGKGGRGSMVSANRAVDAGPTGRLQGN